MTKVMNIYYYNVLDMVIKIYKMYIEKSIEELKKRLWRNRNICVLSLLMATEIIRGFQFVSSLSIPG